MPSISVTVPAQDVVERLHGASTNRMHGPSTELDAAPELLHWSHHNARGKEFASWGAWEDASTAFSCAVDALAVDALAVDALAVDALAVDALAADALAADALAADALAADGDVASREALALVLNNLAQSCYRAGRIDDAIAHAQRVCALRVALVGEDAIVVARARTDLAVMLSSTGRSDEAMGLLTRAIAGIERTAGDESLHLQYALENAARLAMSSGQPASAEPYLLRMHALLGAHELPTDRADALLAGVSQYRERTRSSLALLTPATHREPVESFSAEREDTVVDVLALEEVVVEEVVVEGVVAEAIALEMTAVEMTAVEMTAVEVTAVEVTVEEEVFTEITVDEIVVAEVAVELEAVEAVVIGEVVIDEVVIDEVVIDEVVIDEIVIDEIVIDEIVIDEIVIDEIVIDEIMPVPELGTVGNVFEAIDPPPAPVARPLANDLAELTLEGATFEAESPSTSLLGIEFDLVELTPASNTAPAAPAQGASVAASFSNVLGFEVSYGTQSEEEAALAGSIAPPVSVRVPTPPPAKIVPPAEPIPPEVPTLAVSAPKPIAQGSSDAPRAVPSAAVPSAAVPSAGGNTRERKIRLPRIRFR